MELTILHLYPELMSLYGEYANLAVLRRHLEDLGVTVTVKPISCEDIPDFDGADFIYMGAGTERSQKSVLMGLVHHADKLKAAVENGALLLFTGNAMEMLGSSITDTAGKVWPALALADFTTEESDKRVPHDVIAETSLFGEKLVGFMNKCSLTHGITTPLFTALPMGFGNDAKGGSEGYMAGNIYATHITGPILAKNPPLLRHLIGRIFAGKGWTLPETLPAYPYEEGAYEVTLRELSARLEK